MSNFVERNFRASTMFDSPYQTARELTHLTGQLASFWKRHDYGPDFEFEVPFWRGDDDSELIPIQWIEGLYVEIRRGGLLLVSVRTYKAEILWQAFIKSKKFVGGETKDEHNKKIKLDDIQLDKEEIPFLKTRAQHSGPFIDLICYVMVKKDISADKLIKAGEMKMIFEKWLKEYPHAEKIIIDEIKYQIGRNRLRVGQEEQWQEVLLENIVRGPTMTKWKDKYIKNMGKSAE